MELFRNNDKDYKYFLDYRAVRACVSNTKGNRNKREIIKYIKEKYKDNELYKSLIETGRKLKVHNLTEITKRLKKDFSNYFLLLNDYKKHPDKYRGMPELPKAKKLSKLTRYTIPLDSYNSVSLKKKHVISINLHEKMKYFYVGSIKEQNRILGKLIKSAQVKYQNGEVYLQLSYEEEKYKLNPNTNRENREKVAGIDIGINNLVSLFIDDKETPSIIIGGAQYKCYNYRYNKLISKINTEISKEAVEHRTSKTGTQYAVNWTDRGHKLKRFNQFLTQKRNAYFKSSFHKLSRKIVEYLLSNGVTKLVLSSSLAELKNNGKCRLNKSVKQEFIQIPFIQLIKYIKEKANQYGIEVIEIDEAYTSKVSCISEDVIDVQSNLANAVNGQRAKRGLFKDNKLNKVWNADLNGAVNHIKVGTGKSFEWLSHNLWKLTNPIKLKSAGEFHSFLWNSRSSKAVQRNGKRLLKLAYSLPDNGRYL